MMSIMDNENRRKSRNPRYANYQVPEGIVDWVYNSDSISEQEAAVRALMCVVTQLTSVSWHLKRIADVLEANAEDSEE